jgi:predicted ABC-type ATPase
VKSPRLIVVAGVNGAGKSTLTARLTRRLGPYLGLLLDPDAIARALAPDDPSRAAIQAARFVLEAINRALENGDRFIVETTLSDRNRQLVLLERARSMGFKTWLFYIGLSDVSRHLARVEQRVARGGHDIPDEDVVRRFTRSRANAIDAMRLADRTMLYDNSGQDIRLVASVARGAIRRSSSDTGWWTPFIQALETA